MFSSWQSASISCPTAHYYLHLIQFQEQILINDPPKNSLQLLHNGTHAPLHRHISTFHGQRIPPQYTFTVFVLKFHLNESTHHFREGLQG
mmetsp:Transcript_1792/g.6354  ORF Transcript_1792/g.6354 Transcript_1792/m.6354 type:complete len:90 (-) Transcript_1792:433-702(-)